MVNVQKILKIIKNTFAHRNDGVGKGIADKVGENVRCLREQKLTKEELQALHACYQVAYTDSLQSTSTIIATIPIFLSIDFLIEMIPVSKDIAVYIKGIMAGIYVVYAMIKVLKTSKDNARLRNNIMASAILLAEVEAKED